MPEISERIARVAGDGEDGWEVYGEAVRRRREGQDILMVAIGDHDFKTPAETVEACKSALDAGHHKYTDISGLPELRAAMARVSSRATGIETSPTEVITTPGGQAALFNAIFATMNTQDHGIVVGPYYVTYPGTFRSASSAFSFVDAASEDGFQPDVKQIAKAVKPNTKAILINSPNNPTGVVYSRETLQSICDLCIQHDLWLISDEVYWSLADGNHVSPRSLKNMKERTIVVNSMSKSHGMTGWRVGWLTAPVSIINYFTQLNLISTYGISDFISRAATQALEGDYGVDEIATTYARRRNALTDGLKDIDGLSIVPSTGGMYVMVDVRAIEPDCVKFAMCLLDRENLATMPGNSFGKSAKGHLRLSLCQSQENLVEASKRIRRVAENY